MLILVFLSVKHLECSSVHPAGGTVNLLDQIYFEIDSYLLALQNSFLSFVAINKYYIGFFDQKDNVAFFSFFFLVTDNL